MKKTGNESGNMVEIRGMTKRFGPVTALDRVDLTVRRGEIRGLIGENGSGKSTISSIYAGIQKADAGEMYFCGKEWHPLSMHDALRKGVGMIVQENGTVPGVTVAENLFLCESGRFRNRAGLISGNAMLREAQKALDEIGADHIRASDITGELDLMDRKLIEVAKIWLCRPKLIVVDETTTALSQKGREIIYRLMERMKDDGNSVIFISHDLEEIMEKCDTLTVLRDGKLIRTFEKDEFEADAIRYSMIGRTLEGDYYRSDYDGSYGDTAVLELRNGCLGKELRDVSLTVHKGEILGVGGLSDCGMHTLGKVLFGAKKLERGSVLVHGEEIRSPAEAIRHRVGYTAKDRDSESISTAASIRDNIAIAGLDRFALWKYFLLPGREKRYVRKEVDAMRVKCASIDQPVFQLSGGNKQKVALGKWIGCGSDILILDCPTRGIDIGVKQAIYRLIYRMKGEGKTVVMISEELSELIGMADRILIMKDGQVSRIFPRKKEMTDADIIGYMV